MQKTERNLFGVRPSSSRLPVKSSTSKENRDSRSMNRNTEKKRANSSSRSSSSTSSLLDKIPVLRRSKSSASLRRTPQSVLKISSANSLRTQSTERKRQMKKEMRPIHDKKWQTEMIIKVQNYFKDHPEGRNILNKGTHLRPISTNMFVQLCDVALRDIGLNDNQFEQLTSINYIDLLPQYLKILDYSGNVPSSTLKAANTMHAWPHILAILSWLVELNSIALSISPDEVFFNNSTKDRQLEALEWKIYQDSFNAWYHNNKPTGNEEIEYEKELRIIVNCPAGKKDECQTELKKITDELQFKQDEFNAKQNVVMDLNNCYERKVAEMKETDETIEKQKLSNKKRVAACAVTKANIEIKKKQIETIRITNKILKEKIDKQPVSIRERNLLLQENLDLKEKLELRNKTRAHTQKLSDEMDLTLSQSKRNIEQKINNYNIELIKPSIDNPSLKEYSLPTSGFLRRDFLDTLDETILKKKLLKEKLDKENEKSIQTIAEIKLVKEKKRFELDDKQKEVESKKLINKNLKEQLETIKNERDINETEKIETVNGLKEKIKCAASKLVTMEQQEVLKQKELKTKNKQLEKIDQSLEEQKANALDFFSNIKKQLKRRCELNKEIRNEVFESYKNKENSYLNGPEEK